MPQFDLVLKNGLVVDGTGAPSRRCDVAVSDGVIVEVADKISGAAREVLDADGHIVAPGWIDVHTHFDGQATWDEKLDPAGQQGVTTVVMGNCGVGFAPVRPNGYSQLIDIMEGVEDIPGTALYDAMPWGEWETYPEYLDYLRQRKFALDIGSQIPHGALRAYVLGAEDIYRKTASQAEIEAMTVLVQEGMRAGALGLSANRIMSHRSLTGDQVPGTFASEHELTLLAKAMGETGTGVFQIIPGGSLILDGVEHDPFNHQDEIAMLARISRFSGRPVTFSLFQIAAEPDEWRTSFEISRRENAAGAQIFPQIGTRQSGLLMSLEGYHAFMRRPTYIGLRSLSATERLQALNRPEIKAAILSETDLADPAPSSMENFIPNYVRTMYDRIFPLGLPINYEPTINQSVSGIAKAAGKSAEYVLYDMLLDCEGTNVIMCGENNYVDFNFDAVREMFLDPLSVHGLSDAGAHVKFTCDASFPTHILSYFVRDRTRGERIPLELAVAKLTSRNAGLYEMNDRGRIAPGLRADLNVIDLGQLRLDLPVMHKDLPLGASRILQASHGYRATFVKGIKTRDRDEYTGERPGRLLSGRAYSA